MRDASTVRTRDFPDTFRAIVSALSSAKVEYALGWAIAYGLHAPARFTDNINLLAVPATRAGMKGVVSAIGFPTTRDAEAQLSFEDPASGVAIRIEFSSDDLTRSAVKSAACLPIFGSQARVIQPEYLVWMCCRSEQLKHYMNAIALVQTGHVDLDKLHRYLEDAKDTAALAQLGVVIAQAEREKSSSYEASVRARLARMPQKVEPVWRAFHRENGGLEASQISMPSDFQNINTSAP